MAKKFKVTGGGFVVKRKRKVVSDRTYNLEDEINNIIERPFPEAAKNVAVGKLERKLKRVFGEGITLKQTTDIVITRYHKPEDTQNPLFP